jgi:threonine 3-dehydrogenase
MAMMKALVKSRSEPGLWLEEVPIPRPGPSDVLIRISKTGICGTDLHIYNWDAWAQRHIHTPRIIGHEFVGSIVAVGEEVRGFQVGDRVCAEGHITCGVCHNCRTARPHLCPAAVGIGGGRDGAFAEYLVMPAHNLWSIPKEVPSEIAAIMDPFGNAVHSALSFDIIGEDVLITGAGPIGIMAAAVCRFSGARHIVVTDINDSRLALAAKLGASSTVNVSREPLNAARHALGMTRGFEIGLEMSGNPAALSTMIDNMNNGGRIALLGFLPQNTTINWDDVIFKGLLLKGIYGREIFQTWYKMTHMLQSGLDISPVITHRFPAREFLAGFEAMRRGDGCKVVLEWDSINALAGC